MIDAISAAAAQPTIVNEKYTHQGGEMSVIPQL